MALTAKTLSLILTLASLCAAQEPTVRLRHARLNPFHWIRRAAAAEVNLAERFSAWGISEESTNKAGRHPPKMPKGRKPNVTQANSHCW